MESEKATMENVEGSVIRKRYKRYYLISAAIAFLFGCLTMALGMRYPRWLFILSMVLGCIIPATTALSGNITAQVLRSNKDYDSLPFVWLAKIRFLPEVTGWTIGFLASIGIEEILISFIYGGEL